MAEIIELFDARTRAAAALRELAAKLALPDYPVERERAKRIELSAASLRCSAAPEVKSLTE